MLLSEMERKLVNEQNLVCDPGPYTYATGLHDWTTRVTKNITLSSPSTVLLSYKALIGATANYQVEGNVRVLLGGVIISAMGYAKRLNAGEDVYPRAAIVRLPAGSHTFEFQTSISYISGGTGYVYVGFKDINIGIISFNDFSIAADNGDSGNVVVQNGTTATVKSQSITTPATRKTPVGTIKKVPVIVFAAVVCEGAAISKLKNPGESDESLLNWKLYVNGTQVSWTDRRDDYQTAQPTYGEGAWGIYTEITNPNTPVTVELKVYNNSGIARTVRARLLVLACPWIMSSIAYEPVTLNFPQGSTLYVVSEPLFDNATKSVKIGKIKAASFGDASNYYSASSGIDILQHAYTFESVEVTNCILQVSGFGGCISILAVDVR